MNNLISDSENLLKLKEFYNKSCMKLLNVLLN